MKPITIRPKQMFAKGKAAATDWLADVGKSRERPYPLNVCRAVRQFDMVAQHEMMPNFHELLSAWEEGFDSTVAAGLRASGHAHQVGAATARHQLLAIEAHAAEVRAESLHVDILLQAVIDKLDGLDEADAAVIECFATCTARGVALMRAAADSITALVVEGGAA